MTYEEDARRLRPIIEKAAESLDDTDALNAVELFHHWEPGASYEADERIQYNGVLYRVVQAHTSQSDWTPDITPAIYTEVAPPGVIPVWRQPTGAQDAYMAGDQVKYPDENGSVYESTVDNNVWEPGVYGWQLV